ncbi:MAG: NAD(P)/FAD-dependent oxidoreductase [Pseudomonadales bacterium]
MSRVTAVSDRGFHIAIIGAGISGICMGIQLKRAGIHNFTIYEKEAALGGTWRDNTYPGCGCDVPSYLYSFSFEQKADWARKFSSQGAILEYLEQCVEKYGLKPHISLGNEITRARFIAEDGTWQMESARGDELLANVLVSGCGQLNRPLYPDIEGLDQFEGTCFHCARWDHDHDLRGERVAVIGNGASAIQFIPEIAPGLEHLTVFQRTPNWVIPRLDRAYSSAQHRWFRWLPSVKRLYRCFIYLQLESRWPAFSLGTRFAERFKQIVAAQMGARVADARLRKDLIPEYPIGAKRVLISDDYLEAVQAPNVEVVTSPIARVTSSGVETLDGRSHRVDTIILATGFQSTRFLAPIEIEGKDGRILEHCWINGAQAYLGLTVAGFPNFFMCYGPNSNLGHNSIIFMIECQVRYILKCIEALRKRRLRYLDVREEAVVRYNRALQRDLRQRVWEACNSWYKTDAGKVTNNWAYSTLYYWWKTIEPDFGKFLQIGAGEVDVAASGVDLTKLPARPPRRVAPSEAQASVEMREKLFEE